MFNINQFNNSTFGQVPEIQILSQNNSPFYLLFGDYYLHDGIQNFSFIKYLGSKSIDFDEDSFNINFGNIYNIQEKKQIIQISGIIKTTGRNELIQAINEMKSKLLKKTQYLIIKDSDIKRQVKAICSKIDFSENHYNVSWIDFSAEFSTFDYLENYDPNILFLNTTSNSYSFNIENEGTAQSKIYFVLKFNSASGTNSVDLSIGNQSISFLGSVSAGDVFIIDGYGMQVTKNGNLIDFEGEIQTFDSGINTIILTTNGTVNIDLLLKTNPAYK